MSQTINLSHFTFTLTEEGDWLYKAVQPPLAKKKVQEKPSLKVIEEIEENYLNYFEQMLVASIKEITKEVI